MIVFDTYYDKETCIRRAQSNGKDAVSMEKWERKEYRKNGIATFGSDYSDECIWCSHAMAIRAATWAFQAFPEWRNNDVLCRHLEQHGNTWCEFCGYDFYNQTTWQQQTLKHDKTPCGNC